MKVELKYAGMQIPGPSMNDPFGKTVEILWEVVGDDNFEWSDPNMEYDTVIHHIRPVKLDRVHKPSYERRST